MSITGSFLLVLCSARWIGIHGFSIGIDDVQPGEQLKKDRKKEVEGGYDKCYALIKEYVKGGQDDAKTLEAKLTGFLNEIREKTGKVNT